MPKPTPDEELEALCETLASVDPAIRAGALEAVARLMGSLLYHYGPLDGEKAPNPANASPLPRALATLGNHAYVKAQEVRQQAGTSTASTATGNSPTRENDRGR